MKSIKESRNIMKIIKRSGSENEFDADKIIAAISKANTEVPTMGTPFRRTDS